MTSWILSIVLLAASAAGLGDVVRDQDRLQLKDGSCKLASVIVLTNFNS